ncbi:MAG: hypothetical protein ABI406_02960 [Ktedonobacteraceae bacterium]
MPEDARTRRTLWMLIYDDDEGRHLEPFYALSEEDAQHQAQQWIAERGQTIEFIELRAYPRGFVVQFGHGMRGSL